MFLVFFSDSSYDHRDLHSFPTRRSSDLGAGHPGDDDGDRGGDLELPQARRQDGFEGRRTVAARRPSKPSWRRSEEHTSELQSRQYLVCRLLLEKKKKNIGEYSAGRRVQI